MMIVTLQDISFLALGKAFHLWRPSILLTKIGHESPLPLTCISHVYVVDDHSSSLCCSYLLFYGKSM